MTNDFIRDKKVDLSVYLPPFLLKDPEFAAKLEVESGAHEDVRQTLIDIISQLFVSTATWGLDSWEKFLDIPVDNTKTNEYRRQVIMRKMQGNKAVTVDFLRELINQYIPDKSGAVTDHPETYSADFSIPLVDKASLLGIAKDVRTYIPAHIGQVYKAHADTNVENHIAMLKSTVKTIDVYPAAVEKIAPESTFYVAMAMTTTERLTLYIGGI